VITTKKRKLRWQSVMICELLFWALGIWCKIFFFFIVICWYNPKQKFSLVVYPQGVVLEFDHFWFEIPQDTEEQVAKDMVGCSSL
jgi:hypothetical protein